MKREIKFRYVFKLHGHISGRDEPEIVYVDVTLTEIENGIEPQELIGYYGRYYTLTDRLEFTGLKDKNGVEIYEGDVVRWDDNSYGKYWRECKVVWSKSHYKLVGFSYYADKPSRRIPVSFNFGAFLYEYDGALEIIGNIHENPELI